VRLVEFVQGFDDAVSVVTPVRLAFVPRNSSMHYRHAVEFDRPILVYVVIS